ncbi:fucose permease [Roseibium hamelinense]|uniref:Fucose permease n=1 Tax=Roseibium hamelinense TaxID=150831 RepID=A0A562SNU2_9HYPH|nr:MFS transporter [Roseibium hamelinense]MTI45089.1 MFS transporter [Roseibium hamelinense]TWI82356.1 fucose permease [Roseibium hamelinense]
MHIIRARRAVAAIFFMMGTFIGVWASRIPDIKARLNLDEAQFGLLLLVMAAGAFVSFPVAGHQMDKRGAALVTKVCGCVLLGCFVLLGFGGTVWPMAPIMFVTGFFIGALDVAMNGWGAEVEKALKKPVMSSYHGLYSLGAGVGAGAGAGAIWFGFSIPAHFVVWGGLSCIILFFGCTAAWASDIAQSDKRKAPILAVPTGALLFVGLIALVAALGEGAITDWAALYQINELGYAPSLSAIAFAVFSVAMVIMRLVGDRLIARFGPVLVARLSGFAAVIGGMMLVSGYSVWVVWLGCAVMGLGYATLFPLAMSRAAADPTMSKGAALAAVATLGYGAFLFGPPVLGFIGDAFSLQIAFALVAVFSALIPLFASALKP